jgi:choline dehydrogenase-like flavoprotein
MDVATGENERLMRRDMIADMADMLERCGVKQVKTNDDEYFPGMGIHEMGTARMGRDPKTRCSTAATRCGTRPTSSSPTARR